MKREMGLRHEGKPNNEKVKDRGGEKRRGQPRIIKREADYNPSLVRKITVRLQLTYPVKNYEFYNRTL